MAVRVADGRLHCVTLAAPITMSIRPHTSLGPKAHPVSPNQALLAAAVLAALAVSARAQQQFDGLERSALAAQIGDGRPAATGDVDGDGDLDLVSAQATQLRLALNDDSGVYADVTATHLPPGGGEGVVLADVDGDGDLDLVVVRSSQVGLYRNDGTGHYTDDTAASMPPGGGSTVVPGDVDGDGDLDLVVIASPANRLFLNSGAGTFADATAGNLPAGTGNCAALGDVDGDGDLDLVVGNGNTMAGSPGQQNELYRNNGSGTFTAVTATQMPVDGDNTVAVVMGDIDGDGDLDLICGNWGTCFQGKYYYYCYPQLDRIYLNNGTGTFSNAAAGLLVRNEFTGQLTLGDVDGDGDLDLLSLDGGTNRLYLNNGAGQFTDVTATQLPAATTPAVALVLADVDVDGDLDLISGRLFLNEGSGTFADAAPPRMPADRDRTTAVAMGDVDGDGDLDLVVGNNGRANNGGYSPQRRLLRNDGTGTYTDATASGMPGLSSPTWSLALGDVDGDGDLDLVLGGYLATRHQLLLNNGSGVFSDVSLTHMPTTLASARGVALGDVDGDGDLDLVVATGHSGVVSRQNQLYLNNGSGVFSDATARLPVDNDYSRAVVLGDVDNDGDLDIVFGNVGTTYQNRLCVSDGLGNFTDVTATQMPVDTDITLSLALVDVDGDGHLDLAVGNNGQNRLYLNNGTGAFTDASVLLPVRNDITHSVVASDVDGDGHPDLVLGGSDRLYLNNGSGAFLDVTVPRLPVGPGNSMAVAVGDVDGDGDPDIAFVGGPNRIALNLLRQLHPPSRLRVGHDYTLDVYARYGPPHPTDLALPFLSLGSASIPVPPFGILGIDPTQVHALPWLPIPQPAGVASVAITVPNNPALVGAQVYGQALLVQPPLQGWLTNVTVDVIDP